MTYVYRIGIITGKYREDPTSHDLFEAAGRVAEAKVVDPIHFSAELNGSHTIKIGSVEAKEYDALVIRGLNFRGETDFQFEVFEQLDQAGIIMVNSPSSLQVAESKFLTSYLLQERGFPVPTSLIVQEMDEAERFLREHSDIIAKPLYGFQGHGVIRLKQGEKDARERIEQLLSMYKCVCLQVFIPNPGRDIRAFVVGDQVVASIYRLAKVGRWKTNIDEGGLPLACKLTDGQREMAVSASRCLGLDYTGVDIIEGPDRDYLLEVNGAPAWGGIMEATGRDVARDIVDHVIHRLENRDS